MPLKIAIASDHGGYELKEKIKLHLNKRNIEFSDFGTESINSVNYPDYAHIVCEAINKDGYKLGILVCGTGIGMSIAANKHKGIRAACCSDTYSSRLSRMHNDANVLCLGGRVVGDALANDIVDQFLNNEFEGGRHADRISMYPDTDR
ncbi:MAG: ribose 5-phosphate isomerase B [Eubacteriales bacterium]|jgi:ribose 5-phosphate isomerase B|nr:ribose 5-phosphate isomerase B [Eubacteriales bacterium]